jgi:hypothetical protein
MGDTRAVEGSNAPIALADQPPHESRRLVFKDVFAGATGWRICLFVNLCPFLFLFEDHLALSAPGTAGERSRRLSRGFGRRRRRDATAAGSARKRAGSTIGPTAVPADDDSTRDRARGWDKESRHSRVSRSPDHDALEDAALARWPLPRRPGSHPRPCTCTCSCGKGVAQRQVFGLMGRSIALRVARPEVLVAVASQSERFEPVHLTAVVPTHRCGAAPDSHRVPC